MLLPPHVVLKGLETLPVPPELVARLTPFLKADPLDTAAFEALVKFDPVLTANLIQAANAVQEAGAPPIDTLEEAFERIGAKRLLEVAVGSSLRRTLPARIPGYGITAGKFWVHCIAVATLAEALALRIGLPSPERAFTAGLLHDVGMLAIGDFFAETMPESDWWTFGTPADERAFLGGNHCDVGLGVAERWNLPPGVIDACRWHHEPGKAPTTIDTTLNAVIHVADALAYSLGFNGVGYKGEVLDEGAPLLLGLAKEELLELARTTRHAITVNAKASGMET